MRGIVLIFSGLVCLLSGCTSTTFYKAYLGPERDLANVALLKVPFWVGVGSADYRLIDCVVDDQTIAPKRSKDDIFVAVLPGSHNVVFRYEHPYYRGKEKEVPLWVSTVTWNAQAGHLYFLDVGIVDFSSLPPFVSCEIIDVNEIHFKEVIDTESRDYEEILEGGEQ
jgi:hypothetical protein